MRDQPLHMISSSSESLGNESSMSLSTLVESEEGLVLSSTIDTNTVDVDSLAQQPPLITTALLRISFDGEYFTGWTAGSDNVRFAATSLSTCQSNSSIVNSSRLDEVPVRSVSHWQPGRRRRRRQYRGHGGSSDQTTKATPTSGFVRSVRGVLQRNLAKLYGNIDPSRIVVEGCSRTDKGVHAVGMVAQFYALTTTACVDLEQQQQQQCDTNGISHDADSMDVQPRQPSIPGKRLPHPWSSTDNSGLFVPIPKPLPAMALALNHMCSDIQIMAVAPVPCWTTSAGATHSSVSSTPSTTATTITAKPFHPTLSARAKTYRYTFSVGPRPDPTQWRTVWHIGDFRDPSSEGAGTNDSQRWGSWDTTEKATILQAACDCLRGRHDFAAFSGVPRGISDRQRQHRDTICTIHAIGVQARATQNATPWDSAALQTYVVEMTGDRFLYKMVRFIVGALVAVGRGKLTMADLERWLAMGKRRASGSVIEFECAPPHGLVLQEVHYDMPIDWQPAKS